MESQDIVEWGQPLQKRVREAPQPQGTQVLVRVSHCGVCHSDLHVQEGFFDLGGGKKMDFTARLPLPVTPGHEIVGTVVSTGGGAQGVTEGAQVLVNPWVGCGSCDLCRDDQDNLCAKGLALGIQLPGGFATHVLVPHPKYLHAIDGLDPALAAPLACSGVTTYSAAKKLMPVPAHEWVAVIGCGGLGLSAISALRALGHEKILACDVDDTKLEAAQGWGAQAVCNIREDGARRILAAAGGPLYGMLDFVGVTKTFEMASPALRKGGRYVVCGLMGGLGTVSLVMLALREHSLLGSYVGSPRDLRELVALAQAGKLRMGNVKTRPLDEAEQALRDLAQGKVVGRQVLVV
jgi:D-arabinose 1-dehydrogenase-like Zn-dependent alcohol dehydrogenase